MKILIIENQAPARDSLIRLCERGEDLQVVGEASSGAAGIEAVKMFRPDLLLLAAELPDMTGFEVLRTLCVRERCRTIFMTRSEQEGVTASAAGAAQYLQKPIDAEAFAAAIVRARGRLRPQLAPLPVAMRADAPAPTEDSRAMDRPLFLVGERQHQLYPLEPNQIDFVESAGNYVKYHVGRVSYMARESIQRLDAMLTCVGFLRIERSILLNIRAIAFAQAIGRGGFAFTLTSGDRLHSGHAYRDTILAVLPLRRRSPQGSRRPSRRESRPVVGTVADDDDPKGPAR